MKEQRKTQQQLIIEWFETHDYLTRWEALDFLGIWEAPARICQLKDKGYVFKTTLHTKRSLGGYAFSYAVWELISKP